MCIKTPDDDGLAAMKLYDNIYIGKKLVVMTQEFQNRERGHDTAEFFGS